MSRAIFPNYSATFHPCWSCTTKIITHTQTYKDLRRMSLFTQNMRSFWVSDVGLAHCPFTMLPEEISCFLLLAGEWVSEEMEVLSSLCPFSGSQNAWIKMFSTLTQIILQNLACAPLQSCCSTPWMNNNHEWHTHWFGTQYLHIFRL